MCIQSTCVNFLAKASGAFQATRFQAVGWLPAKAAAGKSGATRHVKKYFRLACLNTAPGGLVLPAAGWRPPLACWQAGSAGHLPGWPACTVVWGLAMPDCTQGGGEEGEKDWLSGQSTHAHQCRLLELRCEWLVASATLASNPSRCSTPTASSCATPPPSHNPHAPVACRLGAMRCGHHL